MSDPWERVAGPAGALFVHRTLGDTAPKSQHHSVLILCHELPIVKGSGVDVGRAYPALADRLAHESGWEVVAATLRGAGGSEGDFSANGWLEDVRFLVDQAAEAGHSVWLAGFDLGGCLALRTAVDAPVVRGVAVLGAPIDPGAAGVALIDRCRASGVIGTSGFPSDPAAWAQELVELAPVEAAVALGRRPLLVVHGADDRTVPVAAARDLATAQGRSSELRIVPGADHWLRADPRVVATLVGWLDHRR